MEGANAPETPELSLYDACERACQSVTCETQISLERKEFISQLVHFVMTGVGTLDQLFKEVYHDITITGCSNDDLKIELPNVYYININLNLPALMPSLEAYSDTHPEHVGEVTLQFFNVALQSLLRSDKGDIYQKMTCWGDSQGRLMPGRVRTWLQDLLQKYVALKRQVLHKKFELMNFIYVKRSFGLTTLQTTLHNGVDIDVYFETALIFENINPPEPFRPLPPFAVKTWSAVTKPRPRPSHMVKWNRAYGNTPPKPGYLAQSTTPRKVKQPDEVQLEKDKKAQNTEGVHWRLSFWDVEKCLLENHDNMKTAIKMIERLRDVRKWSRLSSYFIKTTALHELCSDDWNNWRLDEAFMFLLGRLQFRMERNIIVYYWDERCNLLKLQSTMKHTERKDIAATLSRDLEEFAKHPYEVIKTLVSETNVDCKKSSVVPEESDISCQALASNLPEPTVSEFDTITDAQLAGDPFLLDLIS